MKFKEIINSKLWGTFPVMLKTINGYEVIQPTEYELFYNNEVAAVAIKYNIVYVNLRG